MGNNFSNGKKGLHHLKSCAATGIVFCANTIRFIADRVEKEIRLPVIHIATATATEVKKSGLKKSD